MSNITKMRSRLFESLLGTTIGDSLGLPYEGLTPGRAKRLLRGDIRPRLWFGRSFVSDDTLQSIFVLQSLHACQGDVNKFQIELGKRLRTWFLAIPPGIGKSTILACGKLVLGVLPSRAGVDSGGNGAAMRSAIIGHWFADDRKKRIQFTEAGAKVTHTHTDAVLGAQVVSLAASLAAKGELSTLIDWVKAEFPEWPIEYPRNERGPSGYVVETVNAVIDICSKSPSVIEGIHSAILLGGDTDSVAAIVGGILGCSDTSHYQAVWSPSVSDLHQVGEGDLSRIPWWRMAIWHACQLPIILAFGLRRLLPPY